MSEIELDARGLMCPEPLVLAKLRLKSMPSGSVLAVDTDDPLAPLDLEALCVHSGDEWLGSRQIDGAARSRIRKRG